MLANIIRLLVFGAFTVPGISLRIIVLAILNFVSFFNILGMDFFIGMSYLLNNFVVDLAAKLGPGVLSYI